MTRLSIKEKVFYGLICNENRVYKHWYTRFLLCGVDLARIRRVVSGIRNWYSWCSEWGKEGDRLENLAEDALAHGNIHTAKNLFHEAAACYHVGQHFFYVDPLQQAKSLERIWEIYPKAIALYPEDKRPRRVDIPFKGAVIPGYLWTPARLHRPLAIFINGMDNLKEIEQHFWGKLFSEAGFNAFVFDGPGQGEMWNNMKFIPDYHQAVSAIIDWFENQDPYDMDLDKIGTVGFSLGGYLSPQAAGFDKRISCAVGNGGPANLAFLPSEGRVNPILRRGFAHITGKRDYKEAVAHCEMDIRKAPPVDRPILIFHSGKDRLIPNGKRHGDYFMEWAQGEKELKFYPDGEHVCANYLDEVIPYTLDWMKRHLAEP